MSKREEILALREAFAEGAAFRHAEMSRKDSDGYGRSHYEAAEKRFPLTEKRARLIEFRETTYRVTNNKLEFQMSDTTWIEAAMQQDIILQLVDLFRNPTEEVEL